MAWRLKLSSTFVYGESSTCVHATAKMRTSSTEDIGGLDHFGVRSGDGEGRTDRAGAVSGYRRRRRPTLCDTCRRTCGVLLPHLNMFLKPWATTFALWLISTVDAKTRSSNTS